MHHIRYIVGFGDSLQKQTSIKKEAMSDSSNICLACGLCCDGTLIGYVQLDKEELPALKKVMTIETAGDNGFILHPCPSFCNSCTIYENRPKQCAKFKCELLKSVDENKLAFDTAVDVVALVKIKKATIEKKVGQLGYTLNSQSFYFKMAELKKLLHKTKLESLVTTEHLELIANLKELDSLLTENFGVSLN